MQNREDGHTNVDGATPSARLVWGDAKVKQGTLVSGLQVEVRFEGDDEVKQALLTVLGTLSDAPFKMPLVLGERVTVQGVQAGTEISA
jgi:hypothetical protein